jgi:hypothetical protein
MRLFLPVPSVCSRPRRAMIEDMTTTETPIRGQPLVSYDLLRQTVCFKVGGAHPGLRVTASDEAEHLLVVQDRYDEAVPEAIEAVRWRWWSRRRR